MNGKIGYLNVLRLVATFAVVLIHTSSGWFESNPTPEREIFTYGFYKHIGVFAVPLFVMITGGLILDPKRKTPYPIILKKYVRRIALALLVFGLPMSLAESYLVGEGLLSGVYSFLIGQSWSHMWYLYMLIGLYLLTPIIKPFILSSSKKTIEVALTVLFVISIVLPTLVKYGIPIESWMMLGTPYIFYYVLGYYLLHLENWQLGKMGGICLIAIFVAIIALFEIKGFEFSSRFSQYYGIKTAFGAVSFFLLFKRFDSKWRVADKIAPHCFAIYILHMVFVNATYKFLHIGPSSYMSAVVGIIAFTLLFFILSLLSCYCMRLIPPLKKYVL